MLIQILALCLLFFIAAVLLIALKRQIVRIYVNLNGPFFAPTSYKRIKQIDTLAELKPGMTIADLGAGDGRILIELVKKNPRVKAVGIELDPKYVKLARKNVKAASLEKQITIKQQSFWEIDLSKFDVITVYCVQRFMGKLGQKLKREIKEKTKVISVFFVFPNWKPKKQLGDIRLYQV